MEKLSVIVVVSSEEQDVAACVASVRGSVSEVILAAIADQENVRKVAKAFGARYLDSSSCPTIPQARNAALQHIQSGWVLVLDADERLEPHDCAALTTHVCADSVNVYSVAVRRYVDSMQTRTWESAARPNPICTSEVLDSFPAYMQTLEPRLFLREAIEQFEETSADGVEVRFASKPAKECRASLRVHKVPTTSTATLALRRLSGGLRTQVEPSNALAHFRLGLLEYEEAQDFVTAIGHFRDACIANNSFGPAWLYTAKCLVELGGYQRAMEACLRAEMNGLHVPMVAETMGEAFYREGDYPAARASFLRALRRAEKMQPHCAVTVGRKLELAEWRIKGASCQFQSRILEEDARIRQNEERSLATTVSQKQKEQSILEIETALLS